MKVAALDCEMCYTTAGLSLARVTLLDPLGQVVYDTFVKPRAAVIDFNTRYSGIDPHEFRSQVKTMPDMKTVREKVMSLIEKDTILVSCSKRKDLLSDRNFGSFRYALSHTNSTPSLLPSPTLQIGHALENDLKALRLSE